MEDNAVSDKQTSDIVSTINTNCIQVVVGGQSALQMNKEHDHIAHNGRKRCEIQSNTSNLIGARKDGKETIDMEGHFMQNNHLIQAQKFHTNLDRRSKKTKSTCVLTTLTKYADLKEVGATLDKLKENALEKVRSVIGNMASDCREDKEIKEVISNEFDKQNVSYHELDLMEEKLDGVYGSCKVDQPANAPFENHLPCEREKLIHSFHFKNNFQIQDLDLIDSNGKDSDTSVKGQFDRMHFTNQKKEAECKTNSIFESFFTEDYNKDNKPDIKSIEISSQVTIPSKRRGHNTSMMHKTDKVQYLEKSFIFSSNENGHRADKDRESNQNMNVQDIVRDRHNNGINAQMLQPYEDQNVYNSIHTNDQGFVQDKSAKLVLKKFKKDNSDGTCDPCVGSCNITPAHGNIGVDIHGRKTLFMKFDIADFVDADYAKTHVLQKYKNQMLQDPKQYRPLIATHLESAACQISSNILPQEVTPFLDCKASDAKPHIKLQIEFDEANGLYGNVDDSNPPNDNTICISKYSPSRSNSQTTREENVQRNKMTKKGTHGLQKPTQPKFLKEVVEIKVTKKRNNHIGTTKFCSSNSRHLESDLKVDVSRNHGDPSQVCSAYRDSKILTLRKFSNKSKCIKRSHNNKGRGRDDLFEVGTQEKTNIDECFKNHRKGDASTKVSKLEGKECYISGESCRKRSRNREYVDSENTSLLKKGKQADDHQFQVSSPHVHRKILHKSHIKSPCFEKPDHNYGVAGVKEISAVKQVQFDHRYHRFGGGTSGLGGYSPRRRRSESAIRTPPRTRSPDRRKHRGWDLIPAGLDSNVAAAIAAQQASIVLSSVSSFVNTNELTPVSKTSTSLSTMLPSLLQQVSPTVSLTQATRSIRRLYVGNVPSTVSDGELLEFMNAAMLSTNANYLQGTKPCINCTVNVEKAYAFAEFITPEDATTALAFDGVTLHGTTLKIRRPKDFISLINGGSMIAQSNINIIGDIVMNSPYKVFVGGISSSLTSDQVKEIVTAFGQLKAYHWEIVSETYPSQAYAFIEYLDPMVTLKACAGLNGMNLGGSILTVVQAFPIAEPKVYSSIIPYYGIPEQAQALLEIPTPVLELRNLVANECLAVMSEEEIQDVLEDVGVECLRILEFCANG